jgi:predicted DNA-binding transcriptional regulator AlpA
VSETTFTDDKFLTSIELSEKLTVEESTLRWWRAQGKGPSFVKVGSLVRYRLSAVEEWLALHTKTPSKAGR